MQRLRILSFCLFFSTLSFGQVSVEKISHLLSSNFIGFNGRSTEGPSWDNPEFTDLVRSMNPSSFRYPAGSQANLWDWRTGNFIPESGKQAAYPFTIEQCVNGIPADACLVYVLNMAYPTPATGISMLSDEMTLSSDATLDLKINDILEGMSAFEAAGRLPDVVELGNEFYFKNEHAGVYGKNPILYTAHAQKISQVLKNRYPDIRILMVTTKNGTKGRDEWNKYIFNELQTNTVLANLIDGVVQHHYVKDGFGWTEPVIDIPSVQRAIAEGWMYVAEQHSGITDVPDSFKLWLTEYGATKKNMDGTWGAALRAVAMTLGWLNHSDKIESVFWHHITDDPNVIKKEPLALGPVGIAMGEVMNAMKNKTAFRQFLFEVNPSLTSDTDIPSLLGYCFTDKTGAEELLLVNLGAAGTGNLNLPALFPGKEIESGLCYSARSPFTPNVSLQNGIQKQIPNELSKIALPTFSITRLKLIAITSASDMQERTTDSGLVFDSSARQIRVECPGKIELLNSAGVLILQRVVSKQEFVDLSVLSSGQYIIRFITPYEFAVRSVIL
ncbi:MAG: T9SS type A sorting domain-containing protein [Bacteroidales bacterium]